MLALPKVIMALVGPNQWAVTGPNGPLDISRSESCGLQEAIYYAAANGLGLEVSAGIYDQPPKISQNRILCKKTIRIPSIDNAHWDINGGVIDLKEIDGDGIVFDSMLHSTMNFRTTISYVGNGAAVNVNATSNYPRGPNPLFADNEIFISRLRVNAPTGLKVTSAAVRSRFDFIEIENEGPSSLGVTGMDRGIHIVGNSQSCWYSCQAILSPYVCGIDVEQGGGNRFNAHIEPRGGLETTGVRVASDDDYFHLDMTSGQSSWGTGVMLAYGAERNAFLIQRNQAGMPVSDNSGNTTNRFL